MEMFKIMQYSCTLGAEFNKLCQQHDVEHLPHDFQENRDSLVRYYGLRYKFWNNMLTRDLCEYVVKYVEQGKTFVKHHAEDKGITLNEIKNFSQ